MFKKVHHATIPLCESYWCLYPWNARGKVILERLKKTAYILSVLIVCFLTITASLVIMISIGPWCSVFNRKLIVLIKIRENCFLNHFTSIHMLNRWTVLIDFLIFVLWLWRHLVDTFMIYHENDWCLHIGVQSVHWQGKKCLSNIKFSCSRGKRTFSTFNFIVFLHNTAYKEAMGHKKQDSKHLTYSLLVCVLCQHSD